MPLIGIFLVLSKQLQDSSLWKADSCSASKDKPLVSTQQPSTQTPRGLLTMTVPLATSLRRCCTYCNILLALGTRHGTIKYTIRHIALGCWASCVWRGVGVGGRSYGRYSAMLNYYWPVCCLTTLTDDNVTRCWCWMSKAHWWNGPDRDNWSTGKETCYSAILCTTDLTWTVMGSNPALRDERLATECLNQYRALHQRWMAEVNNAQQFPTFWNNIAIIITAAVVPCGRTWRM
jgi:hypothetical protein